MQFLASLSDKKILYYCREKKQWKWDLRKFDMKKINNSVAGIIRKNILKLDSATQNVLKMASCLGITFSLSIIKLLTDDFQALEQAVSEGMVIKGKDSLYRFAHDQIWQAAYSLIPDNEKNKTRLNVGKLLWKKCSNEKSEDFTFVIANLLKTAPDIVSDRKERTQMAKLFLRAGEKSKSSAAFNLASMYFATGLKLLKPSDWKEEYGLSLKLYCAAAEAAYCQMNYSHMGVMIENVLKNAVAVMDKVPCYSLKIRELNDLRQYDEANNFGLKVLEELGECFPSDYSNSLVSNLTEETKVLVMKLSSWDSVDKMTNVFALASMHILGQLITGFYFVQPLTLLPFAAIRMIHLTLEHGISVYSADGFAWFAAFLSRCHQNVKYSNHVGKLTLLLLEKIPSKETIVNVNLVLHQLVKWCGENIRSLLTPLSKTFENALETADNGKTVFAANNYCIFIIFSGQSMISLKHGITAILEAKLINKITPEAVMKMISIFASSDEKNTKVLIKNMIEEFIGQHHVPGISHVIYVICLMVATYFHEYEMALKLIKVKASSYKSPGSYLSVMDDFFLGLVSLSIAKRTTEKSKFMNIANECIKQLTKRLISGYENILNKLALLQGELSAANGDDSLAMQFYIQSVTSANKSKFIHEEALACEKIAIHLLERRNEHDARCYLLKAYEAYFQWGATAKLTQFRLLYPSILSEFESFHSSFSHTTNIPLGICLDASTESISVVSELHTSSISNSNRAKKKTRII